MKKAAFLLVSLFFCVGPSHAQTFKQYSTCTGVTSVSCGATSSGGGTTWSVGAVTAGDSILAIMNCSASICTGESVPTSTGYTFTQVLAITGLRGSSDSIYVYEADSAPAGTPTIVFHTGGSNVDGILLEYSGLAASACVDKSASNSSTTNQTTLTTGTTATTSFTNELVVVDFLGFTQLPGTPTTGYTSRVAQGLNNYLDQIADKDVTSTGTQTGSASATATQYSAAVFTCQSASQPAPPSGGMGGKAGIGGKAGFGFMPDRFARKRE